MPPSFPSLEPSEAEDKRIKSFKKLALIYKELAQQLEGEYDVMLSLSGCIWIIELEGSKVLLGFHFDLVTMEKLTLIVNAGVNHDRFLPVIEAFHNKFEVKTEVVSIYFDRERLEMIDKEEAISKGLTSEDVDDNLDMDNISNEADDKPKLLH